MNIAFLASQVEQWRQLCKSVPQRFAKTNPKKAMPPQKASRKPKPPTIWVVAVVSLTSVMGHRYYNQPKLKVGTAAPQTLRAPQDAKLVDEEGTETKRKTALNGLVPVLKLDPEINQQVSQELEHYFERINQLRELVGDFPFLKNSILSIQSQSYLRSCQETEWQALLTLVISKPKLAEGALLLPTDPAFVQAVTELQAYQRRASPKDISATINSIQQARDNYAIATREMQGDKVSEAETLLLNLSAVEWSQTKVDIRDSAARIMAQGIPPGLPVQVLREAVNLHVSRLPEPVQGVATELLLSVLKSNLIPDPEKTKQQAQQASGLVETEYAIAHQGEVIVYAGETITQSDFLLLDHFHLSRREINWSGLVGFVGIVSGGLAIFGFVERQRKPRLRRRDLLLLLLLSLSSPVLINLGFPYTNFPAIGLLVGGFYGSPLGVTVVGLLAGTTALAMELGWDYLLAVTAGGIVAGLMAGKMRSREELAFLGVAVGLTQGGVFLLANLLVSASTGVIWLTLLKEAAIYGFSGFAWSVVALGLSPYLERLFDLVTPIRLAELANPNRPLLKRLAAETPGTFQHTLLVATLAEAAARELHCNVELVRAGTLYHDIGKMHDPLGFIENQMGGPNKHDEINDPYVSAAIIKKHVTQGVVIARKHNLPASVEAFIPEHQGTMLIAYFYHQAQQIPEREVQEADFRYDGPIPQSRETGIVMLADSCEAALRSLKEATPEMALNMIDKIFKARWQDCQLIDSGLTREELPIIAEVFVRVWQQSNHQRIAYPKLGSKD